MGKYLAIFKTKVQNMAAYRGMMFIWIVGNLLALMVMAALILAAGQGKRFGGFTRGELLGYYTLGLTIQWFNLWHPFSSLVREIQNGEIVGKILIKPLSIYWSEFAQEAGWHAVSFFFGLAASLLALLILGNNLTLAVDGQNLLLGILSAALSIFVMFPLSLIMATAAFWMLHVNVIDSFFWVCRSFIGGVVIPLSFLPETWNFLATILPLRYTYSFVLEVFLGKLSPTQLVIGFGLQIFWAITLSVLFCFLWKRGVRSYSAFGG